MGARINQVALKKAKIELAATENYLLKKIRDGRNRDRSRILKLRLETEDTERTKSQNVFVGRKTENIRN